MTLEELERRNPEWRASLAAVRRLAGDLADARWDDAVPPAPRAGDGVPLALAAGLDPAETPLPLLHACRRRWAVPPGWARSSCPICGALPAFAELCGVERSRYLRCVRCGAAWRTHALACVFCGTRDHDSLGSLLVDGGGAMEICKSCHGYLKVFNALKPGAPEEVLLQDLASVELDIAAGMRGYRRP